MQEQILSLRKLDAAWRAALEWDRCPEEEDIENVKEYLGDTGLSDEQLKDALVDNCGRRPDEISWSISGIIETL